MNWTDIVLTVLSCLFFITLGYVFGMRERKSSKRLASVQKAYERRAYQQGHISGMYDASQTIVVYGKDEGLRRIAEAVVIEKDKAASSRSEVV